MRFIHPAFITSSLALEALVTTTDLMMTAVDARVLSVDCPPDHAHFENLLMTAGFAQHVPAGSLDPATGTPRAHGLYILTQRDWKRVRGQSATGPATLGGYTVPKPELSLL